MGKKLWKRVVACLVALALVTGFVPSITGGFLTGTGISAHAADGTVVTWNKYRLTEYVMAFQDETGAVGDPTTIDGITVEYYGGKANMLSGLYTYVNNEGVGQTAVKHLLFNSGDSTLKFSSAIDNAFITKVVIEYDHVGSHGSLGDIDVNHNLWTDEDVTNSNGKHTLTLTGPAARTVTLRNHYLSYYYHLEDITSIQFYLTPSLYTTPDAYSNYSIKDLEDSGFTVVSGDTLYEVPGTPFMVKRNGRIIGFAHENSDGTYSYTIDDPREPITYEAIEGDSITVTNADDFRTALSEPRFNTILIGANIDFDSGFTISRNVTINLKARTITCDSSASDKTIRVTGGSPTIISTDGYWEDTVHGNVEGFDKIAVTGGSLNIAAGRYDLPQGLSGSVRVTGGLFKVYDTFGINNLRGFVTGLNGAILRGEYAEVFPHTHAYYKNFTELDNGGISYIYRCDGCDHTVSSWSLTGEEVDTLIALNGGALTPTWTWNPGSPFTAKLKLTISGETYNTAVAEPYNMNTAALRDLRDNGFVCGPELSDGQETVMTNYESNDFNGSNVAITGSSKLPNEKYEWGVPVGITNEPPISLHALNGKTFYKVVFHVGAYEGTAASGARVDKGNITVLDGGKTLVATNINSDSLTLYSTEYFFQISSVDVYYRSADSYADAITVNTEPIPDDCSGYEASYTYRGNTYTKAYTGAYVLTHSFDYFTDWELSYTDYRWVTSQDGGQVPLPGDVPTLNNIYRVCSVCGYQQSPYRFEVQYDEDKVFYTPPTFTADGSVVYSYTALFNSDNGRDGEYTDNYVINIPKLPLTHVPAVAPTCEQSGNKEYWVYEKNEYERMYFLDDRGEQEAEYERDLYLQPLGHLYEPGAEVEWNWYFIDRYWPEATVSFTCARCGEETGGKASVSVSMQDRIMPTADSEGLVRCYADFDLHPFNYDGVLHDGTPEQRKEIVLPRIPAEASEHEVVETNQMRNHYGGYYSEISCSEGDSNGAVVMDAFDDTKMRIATTDGKMLGRVVFHIGNRAENAQSALADKGTVTVSDDNMTVTVSDINSSTLTFSSQQPINISSVEIYYTNEIPQEANISESISTTSASSSVCSGFNAEVHLDTPDTYGAANISTTSGMTVTAKNGKTISKVVFHVASEEDYAPWSSVDKGVRTMSSDNKTITVTNINSDSVRLIGTDDFLWFKIGSVDVFYIPTGSGDGYTRIEATPATSLENGNTEYYIHDGKYYKLDGDNYVEIAENSWIIPAYGYDVIYTNTYDSDYAGNNSRVHCDNSGDYDGAYITNDNGNESAKMTVTANARQKLDRVVFHVGCYEDNSWATKSDKGWHGVSEDGSTITVSNINDRTVTLSINLVDEGWDDDPEAPTPFTSIQIQYVEVFLTEPEPLTYQKVEAKDATLYEPGNTEYYIGSDDKYYVKNGDTYTEIAEGSWMIPAKGVEAFITNLRQGQYVGNRIKITCANVGDDDGFFLGTSSDRRAVITGLNGEVITKIELVRGYYEADNAQCSAGTRSINGDVITFSNVNASEVTLSGSGSVQIKSVTVYFLPYTKVEAKTPTVSENGNIEYYVDSDGKIYIQSGDNFTETTLEAVTLPKVVLSHYAAVAPSCTANGNIEYWFDATNNRYYSDSEGNNEITQAATVVPATGHTYGAPEWEWTEYVVNDHSDVAAWEAIADKISLGTSGIAAPSSDAGNTAWTGSYVYFGQYNGNVMKYRVLTPRTTDYGGTTMLLDYDSTLCMYPWNTMSADFNGSAFLTKQGVFTDAERAAIASSTKAAGADHTAARGTYLGAGLNNEKIFVLEAAELTNPAYGYSNNSTRMKEVVASPYGYWTRSSPNGAAYGGFIYRGDGDFASPGGEVAYSEVLDISPAFNVDLNSVLFSTKVEGTTYKLTLKDGSIAIVPGMVSKNGDIVTVPYTVTGNANRVSVLITDKAYNADGARILYYAPLTGDYSANGSGTFTLPADLDSSCKVYVIAECANGDMLTNYASEPVEINIVVNDHSDVAAWEAIADKISLGTSGIAAPSSDAGNTAWTGSYVYFGQYNGNVMKYRVLAPRTTAYGGATMLLDYDSTLCMYPWNTMSADFNGSAFLTKPGVFTDAERAAIASSTKAAGADYVSEIGRGTYSGVGLNNEKIFVLEAAELTNPAYGYSNGNTRLKEVKYSPYGYWTRSPSNYAPTYGGFIYKYDGGFASAGGEVAYSEVLDISPAFNVNLNSVLFSTRLEGNTYKLTLKDGSLSIVPGIAARNGDIVTVPYAVSGSTANRVSVLITDKAYNADGATILYYAPLTGDYSANGSGTFTLPADLDSSCKVYVIAECANGDMLTNYASEPVEININETYTDSTGTYPIYRDGTLNVSEIRTGDIICAGVTINCDMQCPANGWNWFVYSDAHPYNPTDGGGLTGLATYDPLKTYVVPNNFKVLSVYNHEIKVQENAVIPEAPAAEGSSTAWKARAVFTCAHCNNAQTVTAAVMSATIDASCASDGAVVYTARAALDGTEYTDVKIIQLPALDHSYGEPQWVWIDGNDTCTAVLHSVCDGCGKIKSYNAVVTSETANGMIIYSASAAVDGVVYTSQHSVAVRHTVTIDADANCDVKVLIVGSGSDDGILVENGDTVEEGTVLSVTATPKNGYYLTVIPETTYTVTGDLTITVRSGVIGYCVTVNHEGGAAPTFTGTQSLESVGHGTRITLTAGEPDQDYSFIGWFQQNGVLLTASRNYSMTVVGATTVDARYISNSHTATFMSCGQIKGTYVGTSITDSDFPAAPTANYGYEFTGWSMTASEINSMLELGNVTVEAQFAPIQLSFTVSIYNGESEMPEEVVCTESTLISRTAEAVEGKQFAYWTLNGSIFSYNKKASYTAIESGVLKAVYTSEDVEAVGTATLRTASYNIDTRKLTVNAYLTVPDGSRIVSAGLVASSSVDYDPASGDLTADNAQYNKSLASAVGKCAPVNYTWTKSNVNPGDVWYIRAHIQYYDSENNLKDIYGTLITIYAGTDYDYAERSTVVIRTTTYNSETKKASFNAYLTVPEKSVIVKAGLVAVSGKNFDPSTTILTAENADYVKSLASAAGKCAPVNYIWTKSKVNPGDVWYARAYLVYTLNGVEHTVYGNLVTLTA